MTDVVKVTGAEEKELVELFPHCFKIYTPLRYFFLFSITLFFITLLFTTLFVPTVLSPLLFLILCIF